MVVVMEAGTLKKEITQISKEIDHWNTIPLLCHQLIL